MALLERLRYSASVAEERHFGRAAERLLITQPSLSQQIKRLEAELGVQLLERDSQGLELTSAGETLLARVRPVLLLSKSRKRPKHRYQQPH
jgi:DNA-binding transcriptional LysR family regulator